jgi:hypothetical protein
MSEPRLDRPALASYTALWLIAAIVIALVVVLMIKFA